VGVPLSGVLRRLLCVVASEVLAVSMHAHVAGILLCGKSKKKEKEKPQNNAKQTNKQTNKQTKEKHARPDGPWT
jgi:hypothetical protein